MSQSDSQQEHIFIGRQPIYQASLSVYGYELLYRQGDHMQSNVFDGDLATSQVILNTYLDIGLVNLVSENKAFINLTRNFIDGSLPLPFSKEQVVLEVLEDIEPEPEIIQGLKELSEKGFALALDDFVYRKELQPLIELADIIKIDIQQLSREALAEHAEQLRQQGISLLAEKVETQEEFEFCQSLGFDYFQGYFLARPSVISKRRLPNNKMVVLQLLGRLQDPEVGFDELSELVRRDAALSYKLLNYINSPVTGLPEPVSSIQRALVLLGLNTLKRWITMLVIFGLSDKPAEVLRTAMVRAKMCELMATNLHKPNVDEFFVLGLFSALDALLDTPLENVLEVVKLSPELSAALLSHRGVEGEVLECVLAYELSDWDNVRCHELDSDVITAHYIAALSWAEESMAEI